MSETKPSHATEQRHTHECMRCGQEFYCMVPDNCQAGPKVMPRVVVPGPNGTVHHFEHVCEPRKS